MLKTIEEFGNIIDDFWKSKQGTGRSKEMMMQLNDGDVVVFTNSHEAQRIRRICRESFGIDITPVVHAPSHRNIEELLHTIRFHHSKGEHNKIILDHSFIEGYIMSRLRTELNRLHEVEQHIQIERL